VGNWLIAATTRRAFDFGLLLLPVVLLFAFFLVAIFGSSRSTVACFPSWMSAPNNGKLLHNAVSGM
jgi:hypothetical protein